MPNACIAEGVFCVIYGPTDGSRVHAEDVAGAFDLTPFSLEHMTISTKRSNITIMEHEFTLTKGMMDSYTKDSSTQNSRRTRSRLPAISGEYSW